MGSEKWLEAVCSVVVPGFATGGCWAFVWVKPKVEPVVATPQTLGCGVPYFGTDREQLLCTPFSVLVGVMLLTVLGITRATHLFLRSLSRSQRASNFQGLPSTAERCTV